MHDTTAKRASILQSSGAGPFPFSWLIAPISVEQFFSEFHERRTLLVHRDCPDYYGNLLSIDLLDDFLNAASPTRGRVSLVDARREISPREYTLPDGRLDPVSLADLHDRGATITFRQMHDCMPSLATLCRSAEELFNCPFQTNLYLTPANAQGFRTHYDTHDVFVLQIAGSKTWRVYEQTVELPLPNQTHDSDEKQPATVVDQFTLRAGDLFYCPRGIPHDANATGEISLHITFGALAYSWSDILIESVAHACLNDPAFRASLPPGFATGRVPNEQIERQFRALLDRLCQSASLYPAIEFLADKFVSGRLPQVPEQRQQLAELNSLSLDSVVGRRPGLIYRSRRMPDYLIIHCHSTEMTFPEHVASSVLYALERPQFSVAEVPGLDDAGKLVLVRRLIREGLVMRIK